MIDYTLICVLQGAVLLGLVSGMIGCFALLREQSLLGDALAHAALPGIVCMFLFTHSKNPWVLLCGGALAGIAGTTIMHYVMRRTTLKKDAILGIVLSVFFGVGLVLMTVAQKIPVANQSILNTFLFGNVTTLLPLDIFIIQVVSLSICVLLFIFWKECIVYSFDPVCARMLGFSASYIEYIMTLLLVLVIGIGVQTVGVILMSTMLIAPAAAARQWTSSVGQMVILAGALGICSAMIGVYASSLCYRLPTGPAIVVVATSIVFISLICAPQRRLH